jgi:regulator of protease activity HflC (stomatin/prohibitin superfamily)
VDPITVVVFIAVAALVVIFLLGLRAIRPTHRGLIERRGKYRQLARPGFHWIIPFVGRLIQINSTEQTVDALDSAHAIER